MSVLFVIATVVAVLTGIVKLWRDLLAAIRETWETIDRRRERRKPS